MLCLALLQTLLVPKDKFDAFLLGIDLERGIKGFAVLGSHPFYLHSLTFYEVFILLVREGDAFYFLGDRHSVGTQSDNFIRLWVNGNIGRERLTTLGRYFDGFTQISRCQKGFLFLIRKLVSHIREIQLWLFTQGMYSKPNVAVFVRSKSQASFCVNGAVAKGNGDG